MAQQLPDAYESYARGVWEATADTFATARNVLTAVRYALGLHGDDPYWRYQTIYQGEGLSPVEARRKAKATVNAPERVAMITEIEEAVAAAFGIPNKEALRELSREDQYKALYGGTEKPK